MVELTVPSESDGKRLDSFLAESWTASGSRSRIQKLVNSGEVTIDGTKVTKSSTKVAEGQVVRVDSDSSTDSSAIQPKDIPLSVVFEDEHLAVIEKPVGMAVHPGAGHIDDTLVNAAINRWHHLVEIGERDRPGIVHRLDIDTSGLMILALSQQAYLKLSEMIKNRDVTRIYTAVVHGIPQQREGIVDAPIGRNPHNRLRQAIVETGRPARTHYTVQYELGDFAYLEIRLETGRMHQIRVHMDAIGHPVVGDQTYGRSKKFPGLNRQFLHASRLEFDHPVSHDKLTFSSDLPDDLSSVLKTLN